MFDRVGVARGRLPRVACWILAAAVVPLACVGPVRGEDRPRRPAGLSPAAQVDYERGLRHLDATEFQSAVDAFTKVIRQHPDLPDAYELRALARRQLEQQTTSREVRDALAIRYIADESTAKELRAERELAEVLRRAIARRVILGIAYLVCWIGVLCFWSRRRLPLMWPLLTFALAHVAPAVIPFSLATWLGPVALVFLTCVAWGSPKPSDTEAKPFEDHPLEVALRESRSLDAPAADDERQAATRSCPVCGRVVAESTKFCPRCENKIA